MKSERQNFYHIFHHSEGVLDWKMLLLVIFEILGLVVNILTADNKCSLRNSQNLQQPIQMQLFNKHQTFSNVFAPILKSTSNPGQFEKKRWSS